MNELEKIKKETGFKVPDGYFDDFSKKMMENIKKEENPKGIYRILKPVLSAVAVIIGFAVVSYFTYNSFVNSNKNNTDVISLNYDEDYFFSEEEIIDIISTTETDSDTLSGDYLMDYLQDEVSYDDLLAEL